MSVTIASSHTIGLVSGVGVQFDPPMAAVPALTTDDIYSPDNATQTLTDVLETFSVVNMVGVAWVDMTVLGTTPVYTVSAQQTFILTQIIFILTGIAGSGDVPTVCVGFTTSFRQIIDSSRTATLFDDITNVGQIVSVTNFSVTAGHSGADYKYLSGGDTLTVRVDNVATYPTYTLQCLVFGFVFGNSPPGSVATSIYGRGLYGLDLFGEALRETP